MPSVPYIDAVRTSLPDEYSTRFQSLFSAISDEDDRNTLDVLFRFVSGAEAPKNASQKTRTDWPDKQSLFRDSISTLSQSAGGTQIKRSRDSEVGVSPSKDSKRLKLSPETTKDPPLYTIHSIGCTLPVRKKCNITIHTSSIKFTNPANTDNIEATIPLTSVTRAFLLPTKGKQKAHWTIVLLCGDAPDRSKSSTTQQIVFGLDAITTAPLTTTAYSSIDSIVNVTPKSSETLPIIQAFLSYLPIPTLQPSTSVFKSAIAKSPGRDGGVPCVDAFLGAKPGNLWFLDEGILWGENKPLEFWGIESLGEGEEGVRLVSATGRNCTVILTRSVPGTGDEEEEVLEDTEFGMVDGKEQEGIKEWVRKRQRLFGKRAAVSNAVANGNGAASGSGKSPSKAKNILVPSSKSNEIEDQPMGGDDSDSSDESFEADSDDDGSASSSSSSSGSDSGSGSGSGSGSDQEEASESGDYDEGDIEEVELNPKNHPLMRPGAMPRMSKAAINMAVGMVEDDLMGGGSVVEETDDEDELDD